MNTDIQKLERELEHFKEQYFGLLDKLAGWGLDPRDPRPSRQFIAYWLKIYQAEDTQAAHKAAEERYQEATRLRLMQPKQPDPKVSAQGAVNAAVAAGRLPRIKTMDCQDCGEKARVYHHQSYEQSDWLNVIPLCHKCHHKRHHGKSESLKDSSQ